MATGGRRPPRKPTGFSGLTGEQALEDIKRILSDLRDKIKHQSAFDLGIKKPLDIKLYFHENADESVDGELRVMGIPDRVTPREIWTLLGEYGLETPRDFWISGGLRFGSTEDEELKDKYTRYRGMNQVSSYFGRMDQKRVNYTLITMNQIVENMENAGRPEPQQLYLRIHWNKQNRTPAKRYDRRVTTREENE